MGFKRENPNATFGASDKPFSTTGYFFKEVPGLRHAHITFDLSIVYKVKQEGDMTVIYLYGLFTHDELGTGQPQNMHKQKSMAARFKNEVFAESDDLYWERFKTLIERITGWQ